MHDVDQAVFERNIAYYSNARSVQEYTREEGLRDIERELVRAFMPPPPARIIDLGCGAGRTTFGLGQAGYAMTAIDLAEPLIAHARRKYPGLDFRIMNAAALEFPASSFDGALFSYNGIDSLFPVAERRRCLSEVSRVLKPDAAFILSTHNAIGHFFSGGHLYPRGYVNAAKLLAAQWGNRHLRHWYFRYGESDRSELLFSAPPGHTRAQLEDAGFEVLDISGATGERDMSRIRMRQRHVYFVARKPAA